MSKRLVIIPARGGSTRLKDKNIMDLNGKPLVCHTIDLALEYFDENDCVLVSTDSNEYLRILADYYRIEQKPMLFKRPSRLASNTSRVVETVRYYVERIEAGHEILIKSKFDKVFLMLPTCPVKTKEDIENVDTLLNGSVDSVVSVRQFEFPIELALRVDVAMMIESNKNYLADNTRSQDFVPKYRPNGAIYASHWNSFLKYRNFFAGNVRAYVMNQNGVDIDTKEDFELARKMMGKR